MLWNKSLYTLIFTSSAGPAKHDSINDVNQYVISMSFGVVVVALIVVVVAQAIGFPQYFSPFNSGYYSSFFEDGMFKNSVFNADWGSNLARRIKESMRNSAEFNGISTVNGVTTISAKIGGRRYSAKLPPNSTVSMQAYAENKNGQQVEEVTVVINGDISIYTTYGGRTTVTDGRGVLRHDGGPFHIHSQHGFVSGPRH
ncbi:hypothetical protein DICVIV_10566 [Dictyocaulus viviparus]|uniref:Uncharacterized protein n=1 Tax=Dictyocaulus viviparus TaxID=29172 RepID=A0A0D8XFN9_DICVI|nr:hypothetical protein DICVIV_10566 [Dictyocaulus viviparus]